MSANGLQVPAISSSSSLTSEKQIGERGAALITALIMMSLLLVISASVLAVVSTEANIVGCDLQRTRAFYAAAAGIEKMTNSFSALFTITTRPTQAQLDAIAINFPTELTAEGFTFTQNLVRDEARLTAIRTALNLSDTATPTVTLTSGPFAGLYGSITPYKLKSTALNNRACAAEVSLEREINNYLIPLFQFGMFTDGDMEIHPGPAFFFNGRVHANGNFYISGPEGGSNYVNFLSKVTIAKEAVFDVLRNGTARTGNVRVWVGGPTGPSVTLNEGSAKNGPNFAGATINTRGYNIGSPNGLINNDINWETKSVLAPQLISPGVYTPNQFNKQLLTGTTGAVPLLLPFQLDDAPTREIIKRGKADDTQSLGESRYHNKAQIRILLDDDTKVQAGQSPGWPAINSGVLLENFVPDRLGINVLRLYDENGNAVGPTVMQEGAAGNVTANSVRGGFAVSSPTATANAGVGAIPAIPPGAGAAFNTSSALQARILIQVVKPDGTTLDVTQRILSMGITVGEPNAIVHLQRPLWAAFMQGSRDRDAGTGTGEDLVTLTNTLANSEIADGEIALGPSPSPTPAPTMASTPSNGYIADFADDDATGAPVRSNAPPAAADNWNRIVPINVYNVREGWISRRLNVNQIYERGVTSVVELNMKNLARWVSGFYDGNLLAGAAPDARSTNINRADGYVVYVSDRRGDLAPGGGTTDGMVNNEDVYIFSSSNTGNASLGQLDPGEDVSGDNALQSEVSELPYPLANNAFNQLGTNVTLDTDPPSPALTSWVWAAPTTTSPAANITERLNRARQIFNLPVRTFRRAVRVFNAEDLQIGAATATSNLSTTRGITVATENMIYLWGNYNTAGITCQPGFGSTLNELSTIDPTQAAMPCRYTGDQIPTSIVADAFFPLSKTWADSLSAMYPEGGSNRRADMNLPTEPGAPIPNFETAVRTGIIAGNNMSALAAPFQSNRDAGNGDESRLNGGMHNYPRFLEDWTTQRYNIVGALIPLFNSTQALGPYNSSGVIYGAPTRNWSFDDTFRNPNRLPPGTPQFQYIEPTGFRQVLQ